MKGLFFQRPYLNRFREKRHTVYISDERLRSLLREAQALDLSRSPIFSHFVEDAKANVALPVTTSTSPSYPRTIG